MGMVPVAPDVGAFVARSGIHRRTHQPQPQQDYFRGQDLLASNV